MKKLIASIIAIMFIAVLSACSSPSGPSTSPVKAPSAASTPIPEVPVVDAVPASWDGLWVTDPAFMSAKIAGNLITINIVATDTTSLYWKGTWDPAAKAKDGTEILSNADVPALAKSLMGSNEKVKHFKYAHDELTFVFSMMGTEKTVRLRK